jgi:subtilase family serine protease
MRFTRLSSGLVAAVAAAGLAAAVIPAALAAPARQAIPHGATTSRQQVPPFSRVSSVPRLPAHTANLGAVSGQAILHLDVALKVRDQQALTSFISGLSNPRSPLFHHYLAAGQFGARFGATTAQIAAVEASLRAAGLKPGPVSSDRLSIPVTATVAAADHALAVGVNRYRLPGGRVAYSNSAAPRFAGSVAGAVEGVIGLSNVYLPQSQAVRPKAQVKASRKLAQLKPSATAASGPKACATARDAGPEVDAYTAPQLASFYRMSTLYAAGDLGQGVHVALVEFEPNSTADIAAYESCYKLKTKVTYTKVDGGAGSGYGEGEAALDIDDVIGLAPDVSLHVYQAPNSGDAATYDIYAAIVKADTEKIISTSWSLCELDSDSTLLNDEQAVFEQAATQGQTVFAAAGDEGSTGCYGDPETTNGANLSASDPASQPDVIGVGGTTIGSNYSETVWNDSGQETGAGGGGVSAGWCMPSYQDQAGITGLISGDSVADTTDCPSGYFRQTPDVSADGDPYTGYLIYWDKDWYGIGGTSGAAPLWAAAAALIDASPFCTTWGSGNAVQPAPLYAMAAAHASTIYSGAAEPTALYDVTSGNNDYTPSGYTAGLYPATTGYDLATGLGTPRVAGLTSAGVSSNYDPGLAALLCWTTRTKNKSTSITKISPAAGPKKGETVTLTGSGFLPIAGADVAVVGTKEVTASCSSTTRCTVKLPASAAGKVAVRMMVEDLLIPESTLKAADYFTYAARPSVTKVSPAHGSAGGGYRITIRGTSFTGVTAVRFGGVKGTKIKVTSSTRLTVIVPAGSGTVTVKVYAAGGTSTVVSVSHFRY